MSDSAGNWIFSFRGRYGRKQFWLGALGACLRC
jgi:uncharacterized membrane protein YhaH (DUF805 family)